MTTTKRAIWETYIDLYEEKPSYKITIKELCNRVPVARTTFYSYYQNLDELKDDIENYLIDSIKNCAQEISEGDIYHMELAPFFEKVFEFIQKEQRFFNAFLLLQPNNSFIDKWKNAIELHFRKRYADKSHSANFNLMAAFAASGVIGGYEYWLKEPEKVNPQSLETVVIQIMGFLRKNI